MDKQIQYKHLQLRQYFINLAHRGELNKPLPSERELASMFGVARVTVRTALAAMVKEKYLSKFPRRGYFVNPNRFDSIIQQRKIVGCLFYSGMNVLYDDDTMSYLQAICAECTAHNYLLQIITPSESSLFSDILQSNLDGLIWIAADCQREIFERLSKESDIPMVGLFNTIPPKCGNYVYLNHYIESYQETKYLISCGCRRIAIRFHKDNLSQGYKDALADAGIPFDPALVYYENELKPLLEVYDTAHPDGMIMNVINYDNVQQMIRERSIRVPQDLQLIMGHINEFKENTITLKPYKEIVKSMVNHLDRLMNGEKATLHKDDFNWIIQPGKTTKKI